MPVRGNTYKIFCGNLSDRTTGQDLRELFEAHGTVVEADVVKNFGFVHMEKEDDRKSAIEALTGHEIHGKEMVVEASTGARKGGNQRTKIFVGNLHKDTKIQELRNLFQTYGEVVEADILTNYAFVHMEIESEAREAIRELDGYELHGLSLRVQESTSRVRKSAGMGNPDLCYRCGSAGHWSKECPRDMRGGPPRGFSERGGGRIGNRYDPYARPPPSFGRDQVMRYRDDFDRYEHYGPYDRRPPLMIDDRYERRLPLSSQADYLHYARRSPPPRFPPPPPLPMRGYGPPDRRPY